MKTPKKLHFYLNSKKILFSDIIGDKKFYVSEDELLIIDFCKRWLTGTQKFVLNTSGSTGTPKQISLTRKQMEASAQATVSYLSLNQAHKAFICINTNYIGGIMMIVRALMADMLIIIVAPKANPIKNNYLELIPELNFPNTDLPFQLDFAAFVPLQLQTILIETTTFGNIVINKNILDNMSAIIVGGASLSETQENLFKTISAPVYHTYGMTETVSHIALRRINTPNNEPENGYKNGYFEPLSSVKIRTDERGCLVVSAPSTNFEEIVTNDLVEIIEQNNIKYFSILGRIDNIVNSGGVKIQLEKVEKIIELFLSKKGLENEFKQLLTKNFYCMGLPDEALGKRLVVAFEGEKLPNSVEKMLIKFLKDNLTKYEIPKEIIYKNPFERTETGKIIRK